MQNFLNFIHETSCILYNIAVNYKYMYKYM
jgi:hypothetical protein